MGFNHFWNFIRDGGCDSDIGVERDFNWVADKEVSKKPWIVIDWNNLVMHAAVDSGGYLALLECRLELFFGALARCGARICVIRDGYSHSEERIVVKLKRQHEDLVESVDVKGGMTQETRDAMDSTELTTTVAFALAKKVFKVYFAGKTSKDTENISDKVMYIFRTAVGEADPEIRNFARARSLQGKRVMIMSNDASLLLGVEPSTYLAITRIDSITLKKRTEDLPISADNVLLRGMIYPMATFLKKLTEKSNHILAHTYDLATASGVTDDMIPWIAALLGGETANIRFGQYDDPRSIIWYVKDFLLHRDDPRRNQFDSKGKVLDLLVATVLVRAWRSHVGRGASTVDFLECVSAIRNNAAYILRNQPPPRGFGDRGRGRGSQPPSPPPPPLYSLHSWAQSSTDLRMPASNLLTRFESRVTSANIQAVAGNTVRANLQGRGSWYTATITCRFDDGTVGVTYSEGNPVEDGCPGGLANEGVVRAMGVEVNNRRLASLDQGPRTPTSHRIKWGLWTYGEPIAEDTEALLSPLESLAVQIDFVKDRVSAELYGAAAGDWEQQIEALQHDAGGSVVESFNMYLRALVPLSVVVTSSSDDKEEEEEGEEVAAVILLTSKVSVSPSSLPAENDLPPIYTIADLNDNFVRTHKPIPSNGVIVSSPPSATTRATTATAAAAAAAAVVKFGLKFRSCDRDDPLDRDRGYCRGDVENMYNNTTVVVLLPPPGVEVVGAPGNLLNLYHRAVYLDSIISSLQHNSTWKDGGGSSSTASAGCASEYAATVLFENLGLAAAPVTAAYDSAPHQKFSDQIEAACAVIGACWEKLPCSKVDRDFLVSVNPAKDTAKVLFAVVYSFTALLAPSVKESMVQLGEVSDIIATVTTALLLAPMFAIHALALPAADGSPRSSPSSEINPLSTVTDYSKQLSSLSRSLVLPGGTRAGSRVANLLENVLSLVLNLLGDVRAYGTEGASGGIGAEKKKKTTSGVPEEGEEEEEEERRTFSERKSAQASAEWISHCRWFNVSGVQHVVALRERGESVRSCCVAVDSVLQLGMSTAEEEEEEGGGEVVGDDEKVSGGFGGFVLSVDDAVAAVLKSLQGFLV